MDILALLGSLIEEFMDLPPAVSNDAREVFGLEYDPLVDWRTQRDRLNKVLEEHGLRYYRGGIVLPNGIAPDSAVVATSTASVKTETRKPNSVEELLQILIRGLPRAMHPLEHRRKGANLLSFDSEYDIQDLLHSMLRPWVADIRSEEFTPSYAGSSTRMDFLLPAHRLVIETKRVRDTSHGARMGDELIIDIEHYRRHPDCDRLWCVVYDPRQLIANPAGLVADLEGRRSMPDGNIDVRVFVLCG